MLPYREHQRTSTQRWRGRSRFPSLNVQIETSFRFPGGQLEDKQVSNPTEKQAPIPTFSEAAAIVCERMSAHWWTSSQQPEAWRRSLELHVLPHIGSRPVSDIEPSDVLEVLHRIWRTKPATAQKARGQISQVMRWAIFMGFRKDDPAGDAIAHLLPRVPRSIPVPFPYSEVADVLAAVHASRAQASVKSAFAFLVLTAGRSGEVRGARLDEIDHENAVWTVPAERMKSRREHRVALSRQALAVLDMTRELGNADGLVFPSSRGGRLSPSSLSRLLVSLDVGVTPRSFRASFLYWCVETGVASQIAQACLAQVGRDSVKGVLRRSDLLSLRRKVMEDWAAYVCRAPSCG